MPNPGFSDRGFYTDKFFFGGGPPFAVSGFALNYVRGDAVISTTTVLDKDLIAHSITINAAVITKTNRIIARDTITINTNGFIDANGATSGAGRSGGVYSGAINCLHQGFFGGDGASLSVAATPGGGSYRQGLAGLYQDSPVRYGGKGGDAASGTYATGSTGGYSSLGVDCGGPNIFQSSIWQSATIFGPQDSVSGSAILETLKCGGGAGGGGGGASTTEEGWGGGAGGGVIWMAADKIIINRPGVAISAKGGSADNRSSTAGNGGGGQGGVVILVCNEFILKDPLARISVEGGLGGTGNGDARDGLNGSHGRILIFSSSCVQDFYQSTLGRTLVDQRSDWEFAKENYKTP